MTATAEGAARSPGTAGQVTLRNESIAVASVSATIPVHRCGQPVDVTRRIQSVVNEPKTVEVSYTVTSPTGTLFSPPPRYGLVRLTSALTTVDLGNLDTSGFADGSIRLR